MICERCREQGLKSRVYGGDCYITTAAYYPPFYDEEGKYHHHDGNNSSSNYHCSNGHFFSVSSERSCPNCDWKKEGSVRFHDQ